MKKYTSILLLSAFSMIAGCTMEEAFIKDEQNNTSNGKEITIQAVREDDSETRTVLESDGSVWWTPGDAISLFYGSGTNGGSKFTSNATEISKVTNFTGVITAITGGGEIPVDATYFWGVYPYSEDVSCDGNSVTLTVPSKQTAVPGTFATDLFPSIGRSQGLIMGFYNVCGGWRFSVTKEGVRKVTLKSNNGELITGKVKVGFDDSGVPEVREIIDGSDEVVLECPAGEYFEVGKNYYMIMLPKVFESGFTMTFETYTEEGVYNRNKATTIKRSQFSGVTNVDNYLTTPYTQKTGNIPIEDANFKAYLVENFDTNCDGEISYEEASNITDIITITDDMESVQEIKYMDNLTQLSVTGSSPYSGKLTNINTSNNTALVYLNCGWNNLTSLDISNNTTLTTLSCSGNQLTKMDVSNNSVLSTLWCGDNPLTCLDISNNNALKELHCGHNQLTSLDVSNNNELTLLTCSNNQLTSLDVSNNNELTLLNCNNNQLTSLDVSNNKALKTIMCYSNQLTSLDVSSNKELSLLDCSPMNDSNGGNLLSVLYIAQDQNIPHVTSDRNDYYIPSETRIEAIPYPVPDMVDLGLSVKWASFNLGASNPEEYGYYYSWGEVAPKERYDWETYKWCSGSSNTLTKYNPNSSYGKVDNKEHLDMEDDAANYALHGNWRLPTVSEIQELMTQCTWIPTTYHGVDGYMVYGKKEGYQAKCIFLPDSGYKEGTTLYLSDSNGLAGYYWTSEVRDYYSAYQGGTLYFYKYSIQAMFSRSSYRYLGLTIRPVYAD